jgi:hypothetical protein
MEGTTPRFQLINSGDSGEALDLYGVISVSERDLRWGTQARYQRPRSQEENLLFKDTLGSIEEDILVAAENRRAEDRWCQW